MPPNLRALFALTLLRCARAAPPDASSFAVSWLTPTPEPGRAAGGAATYAGSMPLGNGALTAVAWANVSAGGVGVLVGHQDAMSGETELFKLGLLQVALQPNPFAAGSFFNQTLDVASATVVVYAGGSSMADYAAELRVWVDANTDTLFVEAAARAGALPAAFSLSAAVASVRPRGLWTRTLPFSLCHPVTSGPDVLVDPLPAPAELAAPPPQSARDAVRHATGRRRPTRTLAAAGRLPRVGAFQPGSVVIFHRNNASSVNETLSAQGLASLVAATPDFWQDLTFGFVLDGGSGPALTRAGPGMLLSAAPAAAFQLRLTALAVQTESVGDWLADLAALVSAAADAGARERRRLHEDYWTSFWARSWVVVGDTGSDAAAAVDAAAAAAATAAAAASAAAAAASAAPAASAVSLPVAGATLWLRAQSLAGSLPNASRVALWRDESASALALEQGAAALQPLFVADAFGEGQPAVRFDGNQTFLYSAAMQPLQAGNATYLAIFRDAGSTGGQPGAVCCSGIVFTPSLGGLSTVAPDIAVDDDDTRPAPGGAPVVVMVDFSDSNFQASFNVRDRIVSAAAVMGPSGTRLSVDGCLELEASAAPAEGRAGVFVGSRQNELGRFFLGDIAEVVVFPRALSEAELASMEAYFSAQWPARPARRKCPRANSLGAQLSQRYALTRYTQAVQSRGSQWPLKFNSQAFLAAMDDGNGAPDTRQWGPSNWFQNTRLAYGNMLAAGDFAEFELKYYLNMVPLLTARSQLYWGHGGMWTPETHHLTGAYDVSDYGCPGSRDGLPTWLMQSGYIKIDWAGNSGTGEYPIMALDYLQATSGSDHAAAFLPIAFAAADFLMAHFQNRSAEGRVVVWPAQILESCWCDYDTKSGAFVPSSCCADDTPTVSAMAALIERLLALPPRFATDAQRAAWAAFQAILPELPLSADGAAIAPGRVVNNCGHNGEGPELYAVHPHRLFTAGRAAADPSLNLSVALTALDRSSWSRGDDTWNYGINAAALLGVDAQVTPKLVARATSYAPPQGYRFQGYSPSTGDGDPGLENASNGNRAIQDLLLQSGEDSFASPKIVLFPGWPCAWAVSARLFTAANTTVEIDYALGALRSPLVVTPPARAADVVFARCVV